MLTKYVPMPYKKGGGGGKMVLSCKNNQACKISLT